jgi:hypothetical protein
VNKFEEGFKTTNGEDQKRVDSCKLLGLKLNTNASLSSINSDMRKSNITLGTDKRFKTY